MLSQNSVPPKNSWRTSMAEILIDNRGVRRAVKRYKYTHAIAEFIWNGFDAGASIVNIDVNANEIGNISEIIISDNGEGISFAKLEGKFRPFLRSDKEINPELSRSTSKVHGVNGIGRLTFFKFASQAVWHTVYEEMNDKYEYIITISADTLNKYYPSDQKSTSDPTGTKVVFTGIQGITAHHFDTEIKKHLIREFCWFLELHKSHKFDIILNGRSLDINSIISERDSLTYTDVESGFSFDIRFIQWRERPRAEYSRYYFLDSTNNEKFKKTTTLNNKGDEFYHSLFIQSAFFDNIDIADFPEDDDEAQLKLEFAEESEKEVLDRLMDKVEAFLRSKRMPYIQKLSDKLVEDYAEKGVFPNIGEDEWGKIRENELRQFVRELYVVQPKMFIRLNEEQQKTFVLLLNLVMQKSERDDLLKILDEVVRLTPDERKQLADVLKTTKLSYITKTISLIRDRLVAINDFKLLLDKNFGASEPNHIQKFVESHYWLFGEQYHLVTAAEPDFEDALRRLVFLITGVDEKQHLNSPDKNKEMDIFAIRKMRWSDEIENIVVELKRPAILLGEKELSQVRGYLRVIRSDSRFNASNMRWTFFLVGNRFDTSGFIEEELENNKDHGEKFLVHASGNARIYVLKWSELFTMFELRYAHLLDELKFERDKLARSFDTPDEVIKAIEHSTASMKTSCLKPLSNN